MTVEISTKYQIEVEPLAININKQPTCRITIVDMFNGQVSISTILNKTEAIALIKAIENTIYE